MAKKVIDLKKLHEEDFKSKYPSVPEHAIPSKSWSDRTANGLTKMVEDWCRLNKVFIHRISSEGRFRPGDLLTDVIGRSRQMKGQWLPGLNTGLPDLFAIVDGEFIGIEIKVGADRQSDEQKKMQQKIEAAGGKYLIIKTYAQFQKDFVEPLFGAPRIHRGRKLRGRY